MSEKKPPTIDPITLEMVKIVVISPMLVMLRCRLILMKRGAANVIIPLFIEMIGKSMAKDSVDFFLNSFKTISIVFFSFCWVGGFFVIIGMLRSIKVRIPALIKAIGKLCFSAMNVSVADPIATPVKNPPIIDPFSLPRSFFFVSMMTHASIDISRSPMPHCEMNKMRMNKDRFNEGCIPPDNIRAKAQIMPP